MKVIIPRTKGLRQTERAAEIIEEVAEEAARAALPTHAGTSSLLSSQGSTPHACRYLLCSQPGTATYADTSFLGQHSPRIHLPPLSSLQAQHCLHHLEATRGARWLTIYVCRSVPWVNYVSLSISQRVRAYVCVPMCGVVCGVVCVGSCVMCAVTCLGLL